MLLLQGSFRKGAWAGDGRLEMNHQSLLTPDCTGPVLRYEFISKHFPISILLQDAVLVREDASG